jgi:chromosome segregation ATPase
MTPAEKVLQQIQENLVVIGEIERRHAESIKDHQQAIDDLYKVYATHNKLINALSEAALAQIETTISTNKTIARLNTESAQFRHRTEQNLAEITDKLNGLIGYIDGMKKPE